MDHTVTQGLILCVSAAQCLFGPSLMTGIVLQMGVPSLQPSVRRLSIEPTRAGVNIVPTVMLAYDYILTFSDEVVYVWRRPFRYASVLYIFTRYISLITV